MTRASFGHGLRARRLAQGLGIDEVAALLRLPPQIVEAMENDDRERLGATVFARGRVGSYARMLGMAMDEVDAQFPRDPPASPPLPGSTPGSRPGRWTGPFTAKRAIVAIAVAVTIPMIALATTHRGDVVPVSMRNPASVIVLRDGEPANLAPFRRAYQARFALSSPVQPTPLRD